MRNRFSALLLCVSLLVPGIAAAQTQPIVTGILGTTRAGLNDELTVQVKSLRVLLDKADCVNPGSNCKPKNIALFLNGMPLRGIAPVRDIYNETLQYTLSRTDQTKDVWSALLGSPTGTTRLVTVSVGLEDDYPLQTQVEKFELVILRPIWSIIALVIVTLMLVAFFKLARRSSLLRDPGPAKAASDTSKIPFSLGRVQMAFWFILVIISFLFIWVTTGQHDTISAQILTLIGIGTGTALGSALIDASKREENQSAVASLEAEKSALPAEISQINQQLAGQPPNRTELEAKLTTRLQRQQAAEGELTKARTALNPLESQQFFKDILSDANGITFHRFQLAVWTVVLGFIFCASVYRSLSMPQFSDTLLALMGITSGTYIGFKFPEQHAK